MTVVRKKLPLIDRNLEQNRTRWWVAETRKGTLNVFFNDQRGCVHSDVTLENMLYYSCSKERGKNNINNMNKNQNSQNIYIIFITFKHQN